MIRYRLDRSWRRPGAGTVVVAGSPLRLFRLSTGGAQVAAMVETGDQPQTPAVEQMLDRFVEAGALHPLYESGPYSADDVTVVMPAFAEVPSVPGDLRVIVVDDASTPPLTIDTSAGDTTLVRLDRNVGPGAARNAGLAAVSTPLVAFVDSDVTLTDGWLAPLLAVFADPRVALVAPRVAGLPSTGAIAAYEERHSPLDLGDEPARVAAGTRVSYVPAAAIVCRADILREVGGFDESLRLGEDVDLVWRLTELGHRCRYEPTSVVLHRPRPTMGALLRQRAGYGRSAAALARRHPGALAPVRMSGWSAAVWALLLLRRPWSAIAVAAGTAVALQRKLTDLPKEESARLVVLGHLAAGRQLAKAVTRVWWPLAAVIALVLPRARVPVAAAFVAPAVADAVRARSLTPLRDAPIQWADEMAYGAGVWTGVVAQREPGPLLPRFTTWPRRGGG